MPKNRCYKELTSRILLTSGREAPPETTSGRPPFSTGLFVAEKRVSDLRGQFGLPSLKLTRLMLSQHKNRFRWRSSLGQERSNVGIIGFVEEKDWSARFEHSDARPPAALRFFSWTALLITIMYSGLAISLLVGISRDSDPEAVTVGWLIVAAPWIWTGVLGNITGWRSR